VVAALVAKLHYHGEGPLSYLTFPEWHKEKACGVLALKFRRRSG